MDTHSLHGYAYKDDQHTLEIAYHDPSPSLKNAVQHGVFEFALYDHREVLLFCYRLKGAIKWKAIPYSVHRSGEDKLMLPRYPFSFQDKALLHIRLVDLDTEEIVTRRAVSFPRNFSLELVSVLRRQASYPFNYNQFGLTEVTIFNEHRALEDVVKNATVRCMGEWASAKEAINFPKRRRYQ